MYSPYYLLHIYATLGITLHTNYILQYEHKAEANIVKRLYNVLVRHGFRVPG